MAAACIGIVNPKCGVHMIGRVGDDDMGSSLLNGLRSSGVSIGNAKSDKTDEAIVPGMHTGVASIVVDNQTGQNTIVVVPGANLALSPSQVDTELTLTIGNESQTKSKNVVLVQLEIDPNTALQTLKTASSLNSLTILNPAPAPKGWELTNEWFSSIDILIPNESELAALCGVNEADITGEGEVAMAQSLLDRGVRQAVVVTLGARGAMIVKRQLVSAQFTCSSENFTSAENHSVAVNDSNNSETVMIDIPTNLPCDSLPVIDTVGAGDAFCGALAAYLSRGVDLEKAASMACGVASMSVRKNGAQESYPKKEGLPDILKLDDFESNVTAQSNEGGSMGRVKRGVLTFVTGNKNKLAELTRLLSAPSDLDGKNSKGLQFDIVNAKLDLPELQGTPQSIATEKCRTASERLNTAVITEDTSLGFHALKGLPGPYIKWFLEDIGHGGLNNLLAGFKYENGKRMDRAYAQTIIAFSPGPGKNVILFEGRTEGRIVNARGSKEFGWDPIFEPSKEECLNGGIKSLNKTYAEMTKQEKDAISHRAKAFQKFRDYLLNSSDEILYSMNELQNG